MKKEKKKVAPVSTCSSAANLRPTLPGLPVRTIALVSAQSGKLPFQFSASYKVRVWDSLSESFYRAAFWLYCLLTEGTGPSLNRHLSPC